MVEAAVPVTVIATVVVSWFAEHTHIQQRYRPLVVSCETKKEPNRRKNWVGVGTQRIFGW
jgi:hypothetical protein